MGRRTQERRHSATLPSSPTHSLSSSSDFEFTISHKPTASALCPADDLFYKGQLLPLHLSPRLSMVRTLLLSSPSTSSDTTTTESRDSTASHSSDSSRPSSVTDDEFKRLTNESAAAAFLPRKSSKYFSLSKFSSVFLRKEPKNTTAPLSGGGTAVQRASSSAKQVIRKYLKKVKPLYEMISSQMSPPIPPPPPPSSRITKSANTTTLCMAKENDKENSTNVSHEYSFSGNLSCPSSIGSSPAHGKNGSGYGLWIMTQMGRSGSGACNTHRSSSMESAIQGAIAHCKSSMMQQDKKNSASHEVLV